jgi:hypothetical protein
MSSASSMIDVGFTGPVDFFGVGKAQYDLFTLISLRTYA